MEDWLRPVVYAVLIAATFLVFDRSGLLKEKSFLMRALILLPAFLVVILLLYFIWPMPPVAER